MGLLLSRQHESLQKARQIRQDLYNRINLRKEKYQYIFSSINEEKKLKILSSDASQLTEMMDLKQSTSVEILMCFIQRTMTVAVKNNYVIDQMFEEALVMAMECDIVRKENPQKKCWKYGLKKQECFPPFFGVPCSVKETILMKGRQTYAGFVSKLNPIPTEDTAYMTLILSMGFIPFVRSNVPQACKTFQTNNNIFGYCLNYRNEKRSCGGSSGGQGGLIASCCSPFGIGSDIGGSLRIPAQFNGLCTIKPDWRNERDANAFYGKYAAGCTIKGEPGPLTKSVRDLVTYCDFMFDKQNYKGINPKKVNPHLNLISLDHSIWQSRPKLKIGVVTRLDTLRCSPSHQKALSIASQGLSQLGHELVNAKLQNFQKLYLFMIALFSCSNDMSIMDQIRQGQPLIKEYKLFELFGKIPWIIKQVIIWMIRKKQPRLAQMLQQLKPMRCREIVEMMYEIQDRKAKEIFNYFVDNQLDVLIMPGFAVPSPRLSQAAVLLYQAQGLQYCCALQSGWNVVQYPSGNLPIKLVQQEETICFEDEYNDTITKNMRNAIKGSTGLPVGIQVVSLPRNQEKILYVMGQIEKHVNFNKRYPVNMTP